MKVRMGFGFFLVLALFFQFSLGLCAENWVELGERDEYKWEYDPNSIRTVNFNNVNYRTVWQRVTIKDNPGKITLSLVYFSEDKKICFHLEKNYENGKLVEVVGKENNEKAPCGIVEEYTIAQKGYDVVFPKETKANSANAASTPQPSATQSKKGPWRGGGLFAK